MANSIFGVDGWSCQIKSLSLDYAPEYSKSKDRWTVSATALVTIKPKMAATTKMSDVVMGPPRTSLTQSSPQRNRL